MFASAATADREARLGPEHRLKRAVGGRAGRATPVAFAYSSPMPGSRRISSASSAPGSAWRSLSTVAMCSRGRLASNGGSTRISFAISSGRSAASSAAITAPSECPITASGRDGSCATSAEMSPT